MLFLDPQYILVFTEACDQAVHFQICQFHDDILDRQSGPGRDVICTAGNKAQTPVDPAGFFAGRRIFACKVTGNEGKIVQDVLVGHHKSGPVTDQEVASFA
jgi:hypothetical protein